MKEIKYCHTDYTDFDKALKKVFEQVKIDGLWELIECKTEKEDGCNYYCRIMDDDDWRYCPKVVKYLKEYQNININEIVLIGVENVDYCDDTMLHFYKKPETIFVNKK